MPFSSSHPIQEAMSSDRSVPLNTLSHDEIRLRLSQLQSSVHESLESQFGSTLYDLQQLRSLLGDATSKLSLAFQLMVRQARDQGELAAKLREQTDAPAAIEIQALAGEIGRGAMLVVQSLQFEDMANQLLQHVDKRIAWLDEFSRDASLLRTAVKDEIVGMTYDEFVDVEERLGNLRARLGTWDRKVVQQQSLDEGDIELF
jgi:hypothetical protein